ncbi:MAG: toll/interleukin-1 receptor domain-containing protein [Clostridia bacterium]|nr:toll/interleukin-1 receptor domain-containing protein [Clostridia bacterium]
MERNRYCAFISYRHQSPDQEIAKALHTAIETYGIPAAVKKQTGRKRMGRVFRDQEELPLSSNLGADIERALDESEWMIAICSPRYLKSRWCIRELDYFIERKGRERVLTMLVEGEPVDSFPDAVRFEQNKDGRTVEAEPLAADVRGATFAEQLKKLKSEKLRLLAPMLGLKYDDLKRRARQRRIRIAAAVTAAVLAAGIGLASYVTVNHLRSEALRREAEEQAALAERQAQLAAEQQRIAEQQRKSAIVNNIGTLLEQAEANRTAGERRGAATLLLNALALSDQADGAKREEILYAMRKTVYTEAFERISCFENSEARLSDLLPSPDGRTAIAILAKKSVALIDFSSNAVRYTVPCGDGAVTNLCFSADGSRFAAICEAGRGVRVFNSADGSEAFSYGSAAGKVGDIVNLLFWKDADTLLVQDKDRFLLVSKDGERLFYTLGEQQDGYSYTDNLYSKMLKTTVEKEMSLREGANMKIYATEDRTRILIPGRDGTTGVIVLNDSGERVCLLKDMPGTPTEKYALSPDGKKAACVSEVGFFAVWDLETGRCKVYEDIRRQNSSNFSAPAFSPDASEVAYISDDSFWVLTFDPVPVLVENYMDRTDGYVPEVCYSADGRYQLLVKQHLYIIDAKETLPKYREEGKRYEAFAHAKALENVVFVSRDNGGAYFYCMPQSAAIRMGAFDGSLCEEYNPRDWPEGQNQGFPGEYGELIGQPFPYRYYARDGKHIALAYRDGTIELYDVDGDGSVKDLITPLNGEAQTIGMTEHRLVAADGTGRLLFYDLDSNTVIGTVTNLYNYHLFAFDPSGQYVMAARRGDQQIDVYDAVRAELLFSIHTDENDTVDTFAFSADGRYAVAHTEKGDLIADLYPDADALIREAQRLARLYQED